MTDIKRLLKTSRSVCTFRRGTHALIKFEREKNREVRRVTADAEHRLLDNANPLIKMLIVAALDTGMRRGELLKLRFGDIDFETGFIRVRPENAKSGKSRTVPVATTRRRTLLEFLRIGCDGEPKGADVPVFSRGSDEALKRFRTVWELTRKRAKLETVRFHDFRSEFVSRLVERNVPWSQVRYLLGHSTITTTERYDRQTAASLKQSAEKLDTGEPFNNLSRSENSPQPVESISSTH